VTGTQVKACQAERDPHPTRILAMLRIVVAGLRVQSHWKPGVLRYSQTEGKENKQAKTSAGQLKEATIGNGWHLVLGIVAEGVGLLQAFQDGAYSLQDVIGYARVLGDP
jgi:hypothetical protein